MFLIFALVYVLCFQDVIVEITVVVDLDEADNDVSDAISIISHVLEEEGYEVQSSLNFITASPSMAPQSPSMSPIFHGSIIIVVLEVEVENELSEAQVDAVELYLENAYDVDASDLLVQVKNTFLVFFSGSSPIGKFCLNLIKVLLFRQKCFFSG